MIAEFVLVLLCLPLLILKKYKLSNYIYLSSANCILLLQGYFLASAYVMCICGILLIVATVLTNIKFTHALFGFDCAMIILYVILGRLTWAQQFDPNTGRALVSNITVLIPCLFTCYLISIIFARLFLQTIRNQSTHIELLHQTQQQLLSNEKIESMRLISGGLAHDFNNMLSVLYGNIDMIAFESNLSPSVREAIDQMRISLDHAKNLIRQMLEFSKSKIITTRKSVQINELIQRVTQFALLGRNSHCQFDLQADLPLINVDEAQIGQVIQNLIINASEAMENGGEILIFTRLVDLTSDNIQHLPLGHYLSIDIHDNGVGISETDKHRIFELFFTTKPKGSGLGLAVCFLIVQNHKGLITFESREGKGTTFHVILPIL